MRKSLTRIVLAIIFVLAAWDVGRYLLSPDFGNYVTVEAGAGMSRVQMFDALREGPDVSVTTFPNGTRCVKHSGPYKLGSGDSAIFFDKLTCKGVTGYVNSDRVDD